MPHDLPEKDSSEQKLDVAKAARLHQALTAGPAQLFELIHDPDPELVQTLLKNRSLTEEHLLAILRRRNLPEQLIRSIQRLPQFAGSRRVRLAVAGHPNTPPAVLNSLLPQLMLFELLTLTQLPGTLPDQKLAAERAILKRLPETELGNKVTLARRAASSLLEALLKEGEPRLVEAVLENPRLKEVGVLLFLNSSAASAETISMVARHPRWGRRPNLRFAMLRNRKTPLVWFILFLPELDKASLEKLVVSKALLPEQMEAVKEEWERRKAQLSIDNPFIKP